MKRQTTIKIIAILALITGLATSLWGLSAPLGVWLGVWDFRRGFDLLQGAHAVALWTSIAIAAIAVVVFGLGVSWSQRQLSRLGVFVFISAGLASLTYFIPETFRAPAGKNYPPIHDISTDTQNPPQFVDVLALRANAPNPAIYGGTEDVTPARLAELQHQAYPDIQPWRSDKSKPEVFAKALLTVEQLGWELVSQDLEAGRIEATDTTFWFRFKDDVVIIITADQGKTLVNARSVSRVGRGDVGANAKRLRRFFAVLSDE